MNEIEEAFRDGLRDAVSTRPALTPVSLDEVVAQATQAPAPRRPVGRWIALAAAVSAAAGVGIWGMGATSRGPVGTHQTPATGEVRTLRVYNNTKSAYHDARLQLAGGGQLLVGDLPAGGTALVPMEATPAGAPSGPGLNEAMPGLQISYTGQCSGSNGQLVAVVVAAGPSGQATFEVAVPSGLSTDGGRNGVNVTIAPASAPTPGDVHNTDLSPTYPAPQAEPSSGDLVPLCTVTITDARPTPEPKHS